MSGSSEGSWSNNPNAPQIPHPLYFAEKEVFAGILLGAIFYGVVVALFFRCMRVLLSPVDRTSGGIKWGFVAHTVAMFSFVTAYNALNLSFGPTSYIDNRDFPGDSVSPPGPLGYQLLIISSTRSVVRSVMFLFNYWLADGLLLYRCYIIYSMNRWVIAFPSLLYLASLATGAMVIYWISQLDGDPTNIYGFGILFYSFSLSSNVILTLMIVARLILQGRNIRGAMGVPARATRLYKAAVTMLVESSALHAIGFILVVGPWGVSHNLDDMFFPLLADVQAIAPFLIILRVANQSVETKNDITPGTVTSIHFESQGNLTGGNGTLPCRGPMSSVDTNGENPGQLRTRTETTVDERLT